MVSISSNVNKWLRYQSKQLSWRKICYLVCTICAVAFELHTFRIVYGSLGVVVTVKAVKSPYFTALLQGSAPWLVFLWLPALQPQNKPCTTVKGIQTVIQQVFIQIILRAQSLVTYLVHWNSDSVFLVEIYIASISPLLVCGIFRELFWSVFQFETECCVYHDKQYLLFARSSVWEKIWTQIKMQGIFTINQKWLYMKNKSNDLMMRKIENLQSSCRTHSAN